MVHPISYPAGRRRRVAAWNDRQSSNQLAANIEKLIACRASAMPAPKHLTEFIEKLLDAAGATWWSGISAKRIETALVDFRDVRGLSVSTVNAYQSALKQFTRWMYRNGYAMEDPLRHLSRQNPAARLRYRRRALTEEE